jgi:cupin fold WbuC family metalloprotein
MELSHPGIRRIPGAKTTTYVLNEDVAVLSTATIAALKRAAGDDPLKRARICLHRSGSDLVHQMVIAHHRDTYTHPHRHQGKIESFHVIEGRLALFFFNDVGAVDRSLVLGPFGSAEPPLYRLSASLWHTVVPLSEYAVFHEITNGPYVSGDAELGPWAPAEHDAVAVRAFKSKLLGMLPGAGAEGPSSP